ncbi:hypothetical protein ACFFNY_32405 [Paenibacillus hodogayensis]|uniref:Uncharacterized protein n=1 Tax=Paenibacillus hodogayensis TaxID=279208 RepID=A0ABV5W6W0_9BACL
MLLWVADGSEILEWDGNWEREMEWGKVLQIDNHSNEPEEVIKTAQ